MRRFSIADSSLLATAQPALNKAGTADPRETGQCVLESLRLRSAEASHRHGHLFFTLPPLHLLENGDRSASLRLPFDPWESKSAKITARPVFCGPESACMAATAFPSRERSSSTTGKSRWDPLSRSRIARRRPHFPFGQHRRPAPQRLRQIRDSKPGFQHSQEDVHNRRIGSSCISNLPIAVAHKLLEEAIVLILVQHDPEVCVACNPSTEVTEGSQIHYHIAAHFRALLPFCGNVLKKTKYGATLKLFTMVCGRMMRMRGG